MINWNTKMAAPHTEILLGLLCRAFSVRPPRLVHTSRNANHGTYFPGKRGRIRLSKQVEAWVVAHEFTHHLDDNVNGRWQRECHSRSFYHNLRRVLAVTECAGMFLADTYPWSREYRQLKRWAERDGVTLR